MAMERGTIDDVPFAVLFPEAAAHELEHVRRVAAAVDALRPAGDRPDWHWHREHVPCPEPLPAAIMPMLLHTTVGVHHDETGVDWLELDLDVVWTGPGVLGALASVSVACWCDIDHNTHYPVEAVVEVGPDSPLGDAFERAASLLPRWLDCPHDPEYWRAQGMLPARPRPRRGVPGDADLPQE